MSVCVCKCAEEIKIPFRFVLVPQLQPNGYFIRNHIRSKIGENVQTLLFGHLQWQSQSHWIIIKPCAHFHFVLRFPENTHLCSFAATQNAFVLKSIV